MLPDTKDRPRPKSRLASYISIHLANTSSDRPEIPPIQPQEIPSPKEKDKVYNPDIDLMCSSIKKRMLAHPGKDLPAQYNSFLVHILEAHDQLSTENRTLRRQLTASEKTSQVSEEKYQLSCAAWDQERKGYVSRLANGVSKPPRERHARSMSQGDGAPAVDAADESYRDEFKSQNSYFTVGDGESPMWKDHAGSGGRERRWPGSPSKSMANLSRRLLMNKAGLDRLPSQAPSDQDQAGSTSCLEKQPLDNPRWKAAIGGQRGTLETSDSDLSSTEGDLLPDEEDGTSSNSGEGTHTLNTQNVAVHLTEWLAGRTGLNPNSISAEITAILSGAGSTESGKASKSWTRNIDKYRSVYNLPSQNVQTGAASTRIKTTPSSNESAAGDPSTSHKLGHHRVFSFMPGDDVKTLMPARSNPNLSMCLREKATRSSVFGRHGRSERTVNSPPKRNPPGAKADNDTLPFEVSRKSGKQEAEITPQREDSARSRLTATKNPSPCTSDTSQRSSVAGDGKAWRHQSKDPKVSIAIAAAQAAGGTVSAPTS
ncbi:MAG: hypothetical protein Q9187_000249 [Circinaria calcarea]